MTDEPFFEIRCKICNKLARRDNKDTEIFFCKKCNWYYKIRELNIKEVKIRQKTIMESFRKNT